MTDQSTVRMGGLRANALAATVMLLIQYCFGVAVGLYSVLPTGDHGKGLLPAVGASIANGPVLLSLHAVLGTLLLITAIAAVIRSSRIGAVPLVALATTGLAAILVAWLAGARFVGHMANGISLTMGLAAAVALFSYTLIIFVAGGRG